MLFPAVLQYNQLKQEIHMTIGIIGAGFMGSMHAGILADLPEITLAGVSARTQNRAAALAARYGIRHFSDYRDMLADPAIKVIDICTPTDTHARLACECMKAGKHVIVEYPLCKNPAELKQMTSTSRKTGKICAVAYYSRFQSQYSHVFNAVKEGTIGQLTNVFISRRSSAMFSTKDIINDLVSQDIDWMVSLLGMPDSFSCANTGQEAVTLQFKYRNVIAVIDGATNMHEDFPFTTRHVVAGEKGCITLDWQFTDHPEYRMTISNPEGSEEIEVEDFDPYRRELEVLTGAIAKEKPEGLDIHSIREATVLTFRCRKALRKD